MTMTTTTTTTTPITTTTTTTTPTTTLTRGSLTTVAQETLGFSRRESRQLVDDMLDILADFLVEKGEAKLSSFGSFQVRSKRARKGRNPKTGEIVPIAPRRVVSFRPSSSVRARIRNVEQGDEGDHAEREHSFSAPAPSE